MLTFSLEENVTPTVRIMGERLGDMRVPLTRIMEDGLQVAQARVMGASVPGSEPFAPMSPATIRHGRSPSSLLRDTGRLAASLERGGVGNVFEVTADSGEAGTAVRNDRGFPYGAAIQAGTAFMPPRPFLSWYSSRLTEYDRILIAYISGEAANA